jgi:predicted dehydrogenase
MKDKVRIGIIGTSYWVKGFHLPILQNVPNAIVQAICGRNREKAKELATSFGIDAVFTDYHKMLDANNLDAVIISTPEDQHHPMTMAALEKGLHVLCEKPLALSTDEALEMLQTAEDKQLKHMVNFSMRWIPHFQFLQKLMEESYIGNPYHAHFHWLAGWHADTSDYTWIYDPEISNGVASELGVHLIDQARLYLGEIKSVQASLKDFVKRTGSDGKEINRAASDSGMYLLEFINGAHATIHVSTVNRVHNELNHSGQLISLHGENGTLESRSGLWSNNPVSEIIGLKKGEEKIERFLIPDSYFGKDGRDKSLEFLDKPKLGPRLFVDSILNDHPANPNFYDGYKAQQVIQAALESNLTGKAVAINHDEFIMSAK